MAKLEVWANLPVKDVAKTRAFYRALEFTSNEDHENKLLTSFKFSDGNFVIHFFDEKQFFRDSDLQHNPAAAGHEIIFTLGAESKAAVDQWREKVVKAGGTIFSAPKEIPEGYTFVFGDPDGHRWNVFYWEH